MTPEEKRDFARGLRQWVWERSGLNVLCRRRLIGAAAELENEADLEESGKL